MEKAEPSFQVSCFLSSPSVPDTSGHQHPKDSEGSSLCLPWKIRDTAPLMDGTIREGPGGGTESSEPSPGQGQSQSPESEGMEQHGAELEAGQQGGRVLALLCHSLKAWQSHGRLSSALLNFSVCSLESSSLPCPRIPAEFLQTPNSDHWQSPTPRGKLI